VPQVIAAAAFLPVRMAGTAGPDFGFDVAMAQPPIYRRLGV
jgi:hypothetical protein